MTDHTSASIRPPKDWQDFERNSRILFECILNDIHVQNNGRTGQPQHGVDIFGRQNGEGEKWFGIQCKGKDANIGGKVTEKELREEVGKSLKFEPTLSDFILVTTAPVDESIQVVARKITQEREEEGNPLNVSVWGWGEIEARISEHPRALRAFEPDSTPFSGAILKDTTILRDKADEQSEKLEFLTQILQARGHPLQTGDDTSEALELLDKSLHAEIDGYRDLLKEGKPLTSLQLLESLKERVWETASDRIKFRIVTNIGSAKLSVSKEKEKEAVEHFLEAIQYQPEDKIALANVALAHLLKGDLTKAVDAAQTALKKDEANTEAASYLIQACIKDTDVDDPAMLVTGAVRETESVDVARIDFYRTRSDPRWVQTAKEAGQRHPDNKQIIRFSAEADLEAALTKNGLLGGQKPAQPINEEVLKQAAGALQKLWDQQYSSELPSVDSSLPYNLTQLYRVIGDNNSAESVAIQAIEVMPDIADLSKLRAGLYLENGRTQDALALLKKNKDDPGSLLMIAEIQAENDPTEALETIKNIEQEKELEAHHRIKAGGLRVNCWLAHPKLSKEDRIKEAESEYNLLHEEYPKSLLVTLMHSQILRVAGEDADSRRRLDDAKSLLKADSPFYERYMLARRFETIEGYSDVADILDGYVDASHDSPPLRTLLFSLINSDRRSHAFDLLLEIPEEVVDQPTFLRAAISLHFRRGDYHSAEETINRLLKISPGDLRAHLNRVDVWLRHRNEKAVQKFLATDVEKLEGKPEEFVRLAHLLDRFGFHERALKLGYRTHLENSKNPQVQLGYIGLLLRPGSSEKMDLQRATVGTDTAFSIENASGEKATFVIEEDETLCLADEAVAPTHLFAAAATGLRVGDTFHVKNGEEWKIVLVKHKYLHLLHSKMDSFERYYPDNGGLQRFTIREGEGEKSFEPVLQKVKEKHEVGESILEKYTELSLPLEFFAKYLGTDVIEAWYSLAQTERKFKVCLGSNPERAAAFRCVDENDKAGCVVDALTLHIIRTLGIEDVVLEVCGPIAATESTIDTFRYRREQVLSHGGQPYMTMYWQDGHYYRDEITKERLEQTLASIEKEMDWIDQRVEVLAAESQVLVPDEAGRIRDALSYDFLDPILAAQGSNKLLLCEDQSYRQFGATAFHLRASWLQPVLMRALAKDVLSKKKYGEAICDLVKAGHSFTSIDTNVLSYALEWREENIEIVSKALFGADAEIHSHLLVMKAFLLDIWMEAPPSIDEQKATSILLRRLFWGEWRKNIPEATIENIITLLALPGDQRFKNYFDNWLKGHFLVPY